VVLGRVLAPDGSPLPGASVDVWQCTEEGFYDVQQPDLQPAGNGRGLFTTDANGGFRFRTVVPSHYPIPTDGPVGDLLAATKRHAFRPAHIHFIAHAPGHSTLTTHIFVADGPYLESDAVFASSKALSLTSSRSATPRGPPNTASRHHFVRPRSTLCSSRPRQTLRHER
jgi:hydroxyquinol 1,2-dioxygenase